MLVNGVWERKWDPVQKQDKKGRFIRQSSAFTKRIDDPHAALEDGLRLYVAYICPWATRALIARSLLGLEEAVSVEVVEPALTDFGWRFGDFPGATNSQVQSVEFVHQLYTMTDPEYTGRATVPILWNCKNNNIINNESADILRIFNDDLRPIHQSLVNLYPPALQNEIDMFNDSIYNSLNNGVYQAGFASTQQAYNEAVTAIFSRLGKLEEHFSVNQYAVGQKLTESDIRLFVTLIRFDVAYHGLFKTNLKRIADYPYLSGYLLRLLKLDAFAKNTRIDHIKTGYYSIKALNPSMIVPAGPILGWFDLLQEGV
ncbi:glutathione S-transferase family protein [Psychromonas sp. B3M02]|uniref:glutathione S-transferase C-terminal domain-containing protein n=1 Tax=Psychromonas sp. B3M02 TaxID=2267226 RepID=UPI000DEB39D5|nr:glutathione S-transferase C-terminal domain-containing protein [Psychromonas sp. B3M02]RBW46375.1 glutathione S-transferase family protein [Psychromonas sp. B3M02]